MVFFFFYILETYLKVTQKKKLILQVRILKALKTPKIKNTKPQKLK